MLFFFKEITVANKNMIRMRVKIKLRTGSTLVLARVCLPGDQDDERRSR